MKRLTISGAEGLSTIYVGAGIADLERHVPAEKGVLLTDSNVRRLWGHALPPWPVIEIGMGEGVKNLDTAAHIYGRLVDLEADRSCFLVAVGGGIVCDIAGFVASTYLRGVRCALVPTTLLAQVDASVGGKTGVNFKGYKNLVGAFRQPECVLCDLDLLRTLPQKELACGFAEIVKHAAIADAPMFAYLETHWEEAAALDPETMTRLVYDSLAIKAAIVNRDEKERGERRKLNFGHTFGHAIEKAAGLPHGEAVSVGMVIASALSAARGYLSPGDKDRLEALLERLRLPTRVAFPPEEALEALRKDKKREADSVHFVLLEALGRAVVEEISLGELSGVLTDLYGG